MTDVLDALRKAIADRYAIEREIGSGGMATVYLAEDLKHHRQVALKLLKPELGAVLGGERFLREIRIAASLNHPHILPLLDSGEAEGLLYYVMPYVAGESLRQRLERETQLSIDEAIELTRQVAAALDYAHRQGVVHRDIKPENILLQEGQAVVADFGIARALRVAGGERLTETGLSLGTPHYMSPEQASGTQELDGRSDVYSLACVLYELLVGDPPFTGPTAPAIIARQLVDPVPSLCTVRPTVPQELERTIERALAKVPADRYDTAGTFVEAAGAAAQVEVVPTRERRVPRRRRSSRWWRVGVPVATVLFGIVVVVFWVMASRSISITTSNMVPVTSEPGLEFQPAISPDGNDVAYVVGPIGSPHLALRSAIDVGSSGELRLGGEAGWSGWLPGWTPDGAFLRFRACPPASSWGFFGSGCDWKVVGIFGGSVLSVGVPRTSDSYAWTRDGTRAAFPVRDSIFVYTADGSEPELLGVHEASLHSFAWSPDGRLIAYVAGNPDWRVSQNALGASIWILDASVGEPVRVTDDAYLNVSPQWLPDSKHLLFVSNRDGPRGIYVVAVGPEGPREPPRSVLPQSDAHSISVSADGRRLAYSKFPAAQHIWSIPIPQSGSVSIRDAVQVTTGNQLVESHDLSPDGDSVVYDSALLGNLDIYKGPLTGEDFTLLANLPGDALSPQWSPDGSEIAFHSEPLGGGESKIYVVPAGGGVFEPLEHMPGYDGYPVWSPDGLGIAFQSYVGGQTAWVVWRDSVGADWGEPYQLTDFRCGPPQWDPVGTSLVCPVSDSLGRALVRISREGEVLARYDHRIGALRRFGSLQFSPDGSRIYMHGFGQGGSQGVWWIPATGGNTTKVVEFDDPSRTMLVTLTVGPEHLYLTITEYKSDIWVMDLEW